MTIIKALSVVERPLPDLIVIQDTKDLITLTNISRPEPLRSINNTS